jgi:glutamyl/glutaminyl-tRNA synthetase
MVRSRIAPTPSGYLHPGNAVNFVLTWLCTRSKNGALLLRIDDLDAPRVKKEYLDDIFTTLEWLGLDWDKGPQSVADHLKHYSQDLRKDLYESYIQNLINSGLVFVCNCSRKDLQSDAEHSCKCRQKEIPLFTANTALRIHTPENTVIAFGDFQGQSYQINLFNEMRNFVIRRRGGIPAYQVASLADDDYFNINLIIRGQDLINSTAAQLYLAQVCPSTKFEQTKFYHHSLLKDKEGKKLSKSAGSLSMKNRRELFEKPETFYLMLSDMLGWSTPASTPSEMLAAARSGFPLTF